MKLTCKQVNIRFANQNLHQQRIRYTDNTAASHLEVSTSVEFITVTYMFNLNGVSKPLKVLVFNTNHIVEIECEDGVAADPQ